MRDREIRPMIMGSILFITQKINSIMFYRQTKNWQIKKQRHQVNKMRKKNVSAKILPPWFYMAWFIIVLFNR
jgi:hypothetical protein